MCFYLILQEYTKTQKCLPVMRLKRIPVAFTVIVCLRLISSLSSLPLNFKKVVV